MIGISPFYRMHLFIFIRQQYECEFYSIILTVSPLPLSTLTSSSPGYLRFIRLISFISRLKSRELIFIFSGMYLLIVPAPIRAVKPLNSIRVGRASRMVLSFGDVMIILILFYHDFYDIAVCTFYFNQLSD